MTLSVFLDVSDKQIACLYKFLSLVLTFMIILLTITSPDKDWSMLSPKYLTLFCEEIIWLLQETWKLLTLLSLRLN
jgi:hypothetical protein